LTEPALTIEVLPASYGDCLLVTVPTGTVEYRVLVDMGRTKAGLELLRARLQRIPLSDGRRRIDLLVITHLDSDHIANAAALLSDDALQLDLGDIWFNGKDQVLPFAPERSGAQADEVSAVIAQKGLPLNAAFGGGAVVVPVDSPTRWRPLPPLGPLTVTLLSPGAAQLTRLARVWDDTAQRLATGLPDQDGGTDRGVGARPPIDIDRLAAEPYVRDTTAPNGSSIALLLEHAGASLVLLGDGHSEVYGPALAALLSSRGAGRATVDAIKLSHHGSARNTQAQFALVRAQHYLISSDGKLYGHPDDEALARRVAQALPGAEPTFWFNYDTPLNRRWEEKADELGTFGTVFPQDDTSGAVLHLPARP
jgi:hypothetical protein